MQAPATESAPATAGRILLRFEDENSQQYVSIVLLSK
jgi:hypothetical protein